MITAQVVLINEEGLILGVSRKDNHNDFGLPGGKMDPEDNNDPIATAIRECKEETGLDVFDLRLVFAIHKSGNMGYTYLAKYSGEINHNEPHVVAWKPMEVLINGSFGRYNQMVSESLIDMGVKFQLKIDMKALERDLDALITEHYDGALKFSFVRESWFGNPWYDIYFVDEDGELEETFGEDKKLDKKLEDLGNKYGIRLGLCSDYYCK
jgi:8-oxo-dGTP pyrophosphatase MutT (NUDIX family)